MREIKFRAWDSQNKKMWHFGLFDMKSIQESSPYDGVYLFDDNGNKLCLVSFMHGSNPDVTIMQYTGINNKNGVEIYEGDILWDEHYKEIEIVRFKNGQFRTDGYYCDDISDLKKIGNIYENPELKDV